MLGCYGLFTLGGIGLILSGSWVTRRENGNRVIFTPFVLFCLNEAVFVWPATIYARATGVSPDNFASLVVLSSTFAFVAGYILIHGLYGWKSHSAAQYHQRTVKMPDYNAHARAIGATAILLILLGFYLYQGLPPAISGLRHFLRSGYAAGVSESLADQRLELTKGHYFGGVYRGQGIVRFLMRAGWPYLAAIAILLYLQRRKRFWRGVSLALVAACFIYVGGDGTRGPVLWAFVSILVAVSYHAHLRLRTCLWFVSAMLAVLLSLSLTQKLSTVVAQGTLWTDGVQQLTERIFIGNGINSIHVIEFVRSGDMDLRWGAIHATDIAAALPSVNSGIPFTYELYLLQNPNAKNSRTTLSSMTYLGRLYGDFGWLGCVAGSFSMGVFSAWACRKLHGRPKTISGIAFTGLTVLNLGQLNLNGIAYFLTSMLVLVVAAKFHAFWLSLGTAGKQVGVGVARVGPREPPAGSPPRRVRSRFEKSATPVEQQPKSPKDTFDFHERWES